MSYGGVPASSTDRVPLPDAALLPDASDMVALIDSTPVTVDRMVYSGQDPSRLTEVYDTVRLMWSEQLDSDFHVIHRAPMHVASIPYQFVAPAPLPYLRLHMRVLRHRDEYYDIEVRSFAYLPDMEEFRRDPTIMSSTEFIAEKLRMLTLWQTKREQIVDPIPPAFLDLPADVRITFISEWMQARIREEQDKPEWKQCFHSIEHMNEFRTLRLQLEAGYVFPTVSSVASSSCVSTCNAIAIPTVVGTPSTMPVSYTHLTLPTIYSV